MLSQCNILQKSCYTHQQSFHCKMNNGSTSQLLLKETMPPVSFLAIVLYLMFEIFKNCHKMLRGDFFCPQVAYHISVTFTWQNNSKLPVVPASVSSVCLSHAMCMDSEGNLLKTLKTKAWYAQSVWVGCGREVRGKNGNSVSFVWMGCLFGSLSVYQCDTR